MHFPTFARAFGGKAFTHGTAYYVDSYAGTALWLSPHVYPDEVVLITVLQRTVSEQIQKDVSEVFEQMGRYHPSEPHWFLLCWASTHPNRAKDLAQHYCNMHLSSAIATPSLLISNLQIRRTFPYTNDMALSYLALFRWGHRLPSFQCSADLADAPNVMYLRVAGLI
jgi:hypothetical protein